jgi:hypothetical protein
VHDHVPLAVTVLALQPPNEPPGHVIVKATAVTFPPAVVAANSVWYVPSLALAAGRTQAAVKAALDMDDGGIEASAAPWVESEGKGEIVGEPDEEAAAPQPVVTSANATRTVAAFDVNGTIATLRPSIS